MKIICLYPRYNTILMNIKTIHNTYKHKYNKYIVIIYYIALWLPESPFQW